jgi:hypothetical protein
LIGGVTTSITLGSVDEEFVNQQKGLNSKTSLDQPTEAPTDASLPSKAS